MSRNNPRGSFGDNENQSTYDENEQACEEAPSKGLGFFIIGGVIFVIGLFMKLSVGPVGGVGHSTTTLLNSIFEVALRWLISWGLIVLGLIVLLAGLIKRSAQHRSSQ